MIYLWRFILGCIAACFFGLAALFFLAPLQPGDAPITGSTAIRTEPDGTDATRHFLPNGVSITTPRDWPLIPAEALHQFDRFGLAGRAGNDTRILLAATNAQDPQQASGVLILIDAGSTDSPPVAKLQAFVERIRPKLTQATVIHQAQPTQTLGFDGAWAGFRAVQEGRIGTRTLNVRFDLIHAVQKSVLAIQIDRIGTNARTQLDDMIATLRM